MYEAPDRYKRMIAARLPDGESPGLARDNGNGSSPLKDVQLIARGQLAPFFAAALFLAPAPFLAPRPPWTSVLFVVTRVLLPAAAPVSLRAGPGRRTDGRGTTTGHRTGNPRTGNLRTGNPRTENSRAGQCVSQYQF